MDEERKSKFSTEGMMDRRQDLKVFSVTQPRIQILRLCECV